MEAVEGMIPGSLVEQLIIHQIPKVHHLEDITHRSPSSSRTFNSLALTVFAPVVARLTKTTGIPYGPGPVYRTLRRGGYPTRWQDVGSLLIGLSPTGQLKLPWSV